MLAKLSIQLAGRINPTPADFSGRMSKEKGLILTITIIFVLIIVIMAGVALLLMTNHAGITESQTKRIRAIYAAESAALTQAYEELRTNAISPLPTIGSPYTKSAYLTFNNPTVTVALCIAARGDTANCGGCLSTAPSDFCIRANVIY